MRGLRRTIRSESDRAQRAEPGERAGQQQPVVKSHHSVVHRIGRPNAIMAHAGVPGILRMVKKRWRRRRSVVPPVGDTGWCGIILLP